MDEDKKLPAQIASYSVGITLRQASAYVAADPEKSHVLPDAMDAEASIEADSLTLKELPIKEFEGVLKSALEDYGYTVHVDATRTDK